MNLKQAIDLLRKFYKLLLGAAFITIVGLVGYIWFDNPQGDQGFGKITSPKFQSIVSDKSKIEVESSTLEMSVPKLINVFIYSQSDPEDSLGKRFGFVTQPIKSSNQLLWSKDKETLEINSAEGIFKYKTQLAVQDKVVNEDEALGLAAKKIQELGLVGSEGRPKTISRKYLDTSLYHINEVTSISNYNIWLFQLGFEVEGFPVVKANGSRILFSAWVGVDGKIYRLDGITQKLVFEEKSTYPTKHLSTIKNQISRNETTIINLAANLPMATEGSVSKHKIKLNKGEVVYYLFPKEKVLQPGVLLFSAENFQESVGFAALRLLKNPNYVN